MDSICIQYIHTVLYEMHFAYSSSNTTNAALLGCEMITPQLIAQYHNCATLCNAYILHVYVVLYSYVGQPLVRPQNPTLSACYNRNFTLLCSVPPIYRSSYRKIYWELNFQRIASSDYTESGDAIHLIILNITSNATDDYGCSVELNDGTFVEGQTYSLRPLGTYILCVIPIALCTVLIESNDE